MNKISFAEANRLLRDNKFSEAGEIYKQLIGGRVNYDIYSQNLYLSLVKQGLRYDAIKSIYQNFISLRRSEILKSISQWENKRAIGQLSRPALSIIVPVYNSGKYLEQCLDSIVRQSFSDFELIIVNDGSTDSSSGIIEGYAKKDDRIRYISNEFASGNPGTPRNIALSKARGAYIGFIDSDDWIEDNYFELLMNAAVLSGADIVFSSGFNNCTVSKDKEVRKYSRTDFDNPKSETYKYHESFMIWDKVFSANLINSFDIRLGETKAAVDVPFIFKAYYYSVSSFFCENCIGYNYRRESESSVTVNYRKASSCNFELQAYDSVERWSKEAYVAPFYKKIIDFKKVNSFVYTLSVIAPAMFDSFYFSVKKILVDVDRDVILSMSKLTSKTHVLKKFDAILSDGPSQYKKNFRKDIAFEVNGESELKKKEKKKEVIEVSPTFSIEGENNGIVFFPDWSKRNPYQKLLYSSLAKKYSLRIQGYSERFFSSEMLYGLRQQFDVVHVHWLHVFMDFTKSDGDAKFIGELEKIKELGYKIIYTAHNIISHDSEFLERERAFRRRAIQYFDRVLVHGELAKQRVINEIGADPRKVYIVPHGSYEGYYPNYVNKDIARSYFDIGGHDFVFLFFGNIKAYKGVEELIEAYSRLRKKRKDIKLIIAGRVFEKDAGKYIEKAVKKDSSIIFRPGFIEESDVQFYFNAANVVILPYKKILTSGAAILSFSFKKPILAPREGLLPELTSHGEQGWFFESFLDMYKKMDWLVDQHTRKLLIERDFSALNRRLRWSFIVDGEGFKGLFKAKGSLDIDISLKHKEYEFALIRILGNDLPFRHSENQTLVNLEFTLKNEAEFVGCKKIWLLNRIVDKAKKEAIVSLLDKYSKEYIDVPYSDAGLLEQAFAFEELPRPDFKLTEEFQNMSERNQVVVDTAIFKHKNAYLINNNGARNLALALGGKIANWVFPWDGNCFINDQAWQAINESLVSRDDIDYHIVPMDRLQANEDVLKLSYIPCPQEEPQIIFSSKAELKFDNKLVYGLKPKVDLLKKLGVPGIWDKWTNLYPWKKHVIKYGTDSFNYVWSGWVARLFSGNELQEQNAHERALNRELGIVHYISSLDRLATFSSFNKERLAFYNEGLLVSLKKQYTPESDLLLKSAIEELKTSADQYLSKPHYSVVFKTTIPPSGDIKDYWHPAPYAWPNPNTSDGLPYIHKDGQRVPGTKMYEAESCKYDRTSIQCLFDEATVLALAGFVFENDNYIEKAYSLIHTWFINPETAMNPHLNYSQVVMGKNGNKGTASGLIETKDFYFFLDAVRLVKKTRFWSGQDELVMNNWLIEFSNWLISSEQGNQERRAKNNHGNAYDLQLFAIQAFLGDKEGMYESLIRSLSRLKSHVDVDGVQPHELTRTTTQHYTSFNLHLWLSLNTLYMNTANTNLIGIEQFYADKKLSALKLAGSWVLKNARLPEWPYKQIDDFDKSRYEHIYYSISPYSKSIERKFKGSFATFSSSKNVFFPHDGIAPFWKLSLTKFVDK